MLSPFGFATWPEAGASDYYWNLIDARRMVKIRVTVTVVPEDVYLAAQTLTSAVPSRRTRKIPVTCESPETWTIGQFANKIKDAYRKTYGRYAKILIRQIPQSHLE